MGLSISGGVLVFSSLLLPSVQVLDGGVVYRGWYALIMTVRILTNHLHQFQLVHFADPRIVLVIADCIWLIEILCATFSALFLTLLLFTRRNSGLLRSLIVSCIPAVWSLPIAIGYKGLHVGFIVWCVGLSLVAFSQKTTRSAYYASGITGALFCYPLQHCKLLLVLKGRMRPLTPLKF